jgi:hypothetical protein
MYKKYKTIRLRYSIERDAVKHIQRYLNISYLIM